MMHQRITLPHPWGALEFFDLMEPVREAENEWIFRNRLYIADHRYEGGRFLLREGPEFAMPKTTKSVAANDDETLIEDPA